MLEAARRRQVERAPHKAIFLMFPFCFLSCSLYCEVLFTLLHSILGISGEANLGHGWNSSFGAWTRFQDTDSIQAYANHDYKYSNTASYGLASTVHEQQYSMMKMIRE